MLKYPLFILAYLISLTIVFAFIIILSLLMILKGILWDFKFEFPDKTKDPLRLIEMWGVSMNIPMSLWEESKGWFFDNVILIAVIAVILVVAILSIVFVLYGGRSGKIGAESSGDS